MRRRWGIPKGPPPLRWWFPQKIPTGDPLGGLHWKPCWGIPEGTPQGIPWVLPCGISCGIPWEFPQGLPWGTLGESPGGSPGGSPGASTTIAARGISLRIPGDSRGSGAERRSTARPGTVIPLKSGGLHCAAARLAHPWIQTKQFLKSTKSNKI